MLKMLFPRENVLGAAQRLAIGGNVCDGFCIGLDSCGALEEEGGRQLVDVMVVGKVICGIGR